MFKRIFIFVFFLACLAGITESMFVAPSVYAYKQLSSWESEKGDFLVFDVSENMGYLLKEDMSEGVYFPIASGEQRNRYFQGNRYYAGTPIQEWRIKSMHYHPKGPIYGKHGKFLRLYDENEATHYGVHTVGSEKEIFSMSDRYKSWGCVIVKGDTFSIIESIYEVNEEEGVRVITVDDESDFPLGFVKLTGLRFL